MPDRNFLERITDAVTQLRDPLPTKMLGDITPEFKSEMHFSRSQGPEWLSTAFAKAWFNGSSFPQPIDYRHEAGDLRASSLVMACANYLGTEMLFSPPQVTIEDKDGKTEVVPNHPAVKLLNRPNPHYAGGLLWSAFAADWWIDGNVYWHKIRDGKNRVSELWPIPHYMIEPRTDPADNTVFIKDYEYKVDGRSYYLPPEDVIHFRRGPLRDRKGTGAFDSMLVEIFGDKEASRFKAALLRNMGVFSFIVTPKQEVSVDKTKLDALKEHFIRHTTGDERGKPMVHGLPLDVKELSFSPEQLQLNESHAIPESRAAAVTMIPAPLLQFLTGLQNGTSYAAYEQARKQGYQSVVIPIEDYTADELTSQLLHPQQNNQGKIIPGMGKETETLGFDRSKVPILQEDRGSLMSRWTGAFQGGVVMRSAALKAIGETPDAGGADDVYVLSAGATLIDQNGVPINSPAIANGEELPPSDPASLAKFLEQERVIEDMELQMQEFMRK